ncbi:MAG: hypothetical protein K1X85_06785 [Ignavibacteria bacterium]|nr:hypothetical protein [Ignavibacteria bacterium]
MRIHPPDSITVVQIGKLGDMILTTPLLRKLRSIFPHTELRILASEHNSLIARACGLADNVFIYHKHPVKDLKLLYSGLRRSGLWIDAKMEPSDTSALFLRLFSPASSLGYSGPKAKFAIDLSNFRQGDHYVDIQLAAVKALGEDYSEADRTPCLPLSDASNVRATNSETELTRLRVLLNISAGKEGRRLEPAVSEEIIGLIRSKTDAAFRIISHPGDSDLANGLAGKTGSQHIHTETIMDAAREVCESDIVISPDTSVIHLCSAYNTPVVGIYPDVEWNLRRFAPLSTLSETIISGSDAGLKKVKPQKVAEAFLRLADTVNRGNAESRTRVRKEDH